MRLIDADALVKELSEKYIVPVDEATRGVAAFMGIQTRQAINNAPTVDVVPLEDYRSMEQTVYKLTQALAEVEPYIEFCEWVADTVLYEDFEDKWTLGAFAEVACRKLHKLGFVRKDGEYWTMDEVTE